MREISLNRPLYELDFHKSLFAYFKQKKMYLVADLISANQFQVLSELNEIKPQLSFRLEERMIDLGLKFNSSLHGEVLESNMKKHTEYLYQKEKNYQKMIESKPLVSMYSPLNVLNLPISKSTYNSLIRSLEKIDINSLLKLDYWDMAKDLKISSEVDLVNAIHTLGFLFDFELKPEDLEKRNLERANHSHNNDIYDIENTGIEVLGFTNRTYGCLKRAEIDTVDELLALTENDFKKISGLGTRSLEEIKNRISTCNFYYEKEADIKENIEPLNYKLEEDIENTPKRQVNFSEENLLDKVLKLEQKQQYMIKEMFKLQEEITVIKMRLEGNQKKK